MAALVYKNCIVAISPNKNVLLVNPGICETSDQDLLDLLDGSYVLDNINFSKDGNPWSFEPGVYLSDICFEFSSSFNGEHTEYDSYTELLIKGKVEIPIELKDKIAGLSNEDIKTAGLIFENLLLECLEDTEQNKISHYMQSIKQGAAYLSDNVTKHLFYGYIK